MSADVLFVEDDEIDLLAFRRFLRERGLPYRVKTASSVAGAWEALAQTRFDVVISDWGLGDGTALDVLARAGDAAGIIITGGGDEARAVTGMKAGAHDYLIKDLGRSYLDLIPETVASALRHVRQAREIRFLTLALSSVDDGVCTVSPDGHVTYANASYCQLFARTLAELADGPAPTQVVPEGEDLLLLVGGAERAINVHRSPIRDAQGIAAGEVHVARDVTARRRAEEALRAANASLERSRAALAEAAIRDELTGLYNRREWNRSLAAELDRCRRYPPQAVSVVLVDLDHFKRVNDTWGHAAGDAVLRTVADVLRNALRSVDRVARLGGEEMGLLLPQTDRAGASTVAERLRRAIASLEIEVPSQDGSSTVTVRVTASFGVASSDGRMTGAELMQVADAALYEAKRDGRDRVVLAGVSRSAA